MLKKYKIGLRAVKSAIAVFLCLLYALVFKRTEAILASIAAMICMQQTYDETYKTGLNRLIGTVMGGIVGLVVLVLLKFLHVGYRDYVNLFLAPICLLLIIYICNIIERKESVVIGAIVFLIVLLNSDPKYGNICWYVVGRVIDTSVGVVIAMLINKYSFRKKSAINRNS